MKALLQMPLALLVTLGLIAGAIYGLGDRSVLVPPPEAVVEGFVRKLETGRYSVALDHLSEAQRQRNDAERLRRLSEELRQRTGPIYDVRGEAGPMNEYRGEATAVLNLKHERSAELKFGLRFEHGLWRIDDLGELAVGGAS
jgi:hypothetical protein